MITPSQESDAMVVSQRSLNESDRMTVDESPFVSRHKREHESNYSEDNRRPYYKSRNFDEPDQHAIISLAHMATSGSYYQNLVGEQCPFCQNIIAGGIEDLQMHMVTVCPDYPDRQQEGDQDMLQA
jgi:hypothetical protein